MAPDTHPVCAPARTAEHLRTAPDGPVAVLHHTRSALYVEVAGRCVGVVAPGAAQVPCALRVGEGPPGVSPTEVLSAEPLSAYVERGTLYLTGHPLRIGRFVDVRVPRIDPSRVLGRAASPANAVARPPRPAADGLAAHLPVTDGRALAAPVLPRPAADGLAAHLPVTDGRALAAPVLAALEDLPDLPPQVDAAILRDLVGNGGGLTPLGDDVLCGWLAVLFAVDRLTDHVADDVRGVYDRTTVLSATLIDCALHGEVLPEFAAYVTALGTPAEAAAARALTAIGHTSGAGLWWGAQHALRTLAMEEAA